jgi:outer membrane immunogenic protein
MRRIRTLLLCTTAAVGVASAAVAADRPIKKAPPRVAVVAPVAATWTGCFVGGHGGYGWGRKDLTNIFVDGDAGGTTFSGTIANERVNTDGFLGGVQVGCDQQFHPNWVIGIEGTFSWAGIKGDTTRAPFDPF